MPHDAESTRPSCQPDLTRKEFLALVLKRGAIGGAILFAPKILDKFLVPPVEAATMYTGCPDTSRLQDTTPHGTTCDSG